MNKGYPNWYYVDVSTLFFFVFTYVYFPVAFTFPGLTNGKFLNISLVCLVLNLVIFVKRRTSERFGVKAKPRRGKLPQNNCFKVLKCPDGAIMSVCMRHMTRPRVPVLHFYLFANQQSAIFCM